jgi:hypothetical protein
MPKMPKKKVPKVRKMLKVKKWEKIALAFFLSAGNNAVTAAFLWG